MFTLPKCWVFPESLYQMSQLFSISLCTFQKFWKTEALNTFCVSHLGRPHWPCELWKCQLGDVSPFCINDKRRQQCSLRISHISSKQTDCSEISLCNPYDDKGHFIHWCSCTIWEHEQSYWVFLTRWGQKTKKLKVNQSQLFQTDPAEPAVCTQSSADRSSTLYL